MTLTAKEVRVIIREELERLAFPSRTYDDGVHLMRVLNDGTTWTYSSDDDHWTEVKPE